MEHKISALLSSSAELKAKLAADIDFVKTVQQSAQMLAQSLKSGGTIYVCGNGGSACDAAHFVEELVARYKRDRIGMRAMHFNDPGVLSCWSNDYSFETSFERQAQVFCTSRDVLVGISTSGNSENVLRAINAAKSQGCRTIGLTGKDGGKLKSASELSLLIPAKETERIQEAHITVIHIWCELLETDLKWF